MAGLSALVSFASTIWLIFSGPSRKNATRLDEVGKRQDTHELRINALEQRHGAIPTKDDMHAVSMALEGIKGEMKAIRAEMKGNTDIMERLENIVGRHENHLLEGGGRR